MPWLLPTTWPDGYVDWAFVEARGGRSSRRVGDGRDTRGDWTTTQGVLPEILKSEQHLKHAFELATKVRDNHLRAFMSAYYLHTPRYHARVVLQTCEQLATELAAMAKAVLSLTPVSCPRALDPPLVVFVSHISIVSEPALIIRVSNLQISTLQFHEPAPPVRYFFRIHLPPSSPSRTLG
ncbi:hypothetical protein GSI_05026 [Ganoderma sinense ZZ0214-1]|uniref:Uncharacterized protein n=1 Tax=Ganoderma sinense ZZ0214-1 TaxID=1077348 RepID=A0A2G8SH62_9APHY|nr:hypothetical protein GSI_05018 [Ganoderma sinense ZZ0214-1]PIL32908.1 hypothetical protein GSI_05026 [Ganoderma sinense ZZ0214-1]